MEFPRFGCKGSLGGIGHWLAHQICQGLINSWGFDLGLGMTVCVEDLGRCFMILNVYGPSQERIQFWDNLLNKSFLKKEDLILGGDLNFSLGTTESWGQRAIPDALIRLLQS
jgi:hypothetical protein